MSYIPERLLKLEERPGDYWRDGLLYCGKCNTPRSYRLALDDGERIVPCACSCDLEAEAAAAEKARTERIERLRERFLHLAEMRAARFESAEESKAVTIAVCRRMGRCTEQKYRSALLRQHRLRQNFRGSLYL